MTVEELKDYLEFNMTLHPTSGVYLQVGGRALPLTKDMLEWEENRLSTTSMLNIVVEVE